ncbi:MAG: hypothetical protein WB810_12565, partial [Candidatus Cybelea sp.]
MIVPDLLAKNRGTIRCMLSRVMEGESDLERFLDCAIFGPQSSFGHQLRQFRLAEMVAKRLQEPFRFHF